MTGTPCRLKGVLSMNPCSMLQLNMCRRPDLATTLGFGLTIEDSWGGDIITAAIAHLAHSTPERFRFTSTDFNSYVTVSIAEGAPTRQDGMMRASTAPGLGVEPRMDVLGDPLLVIE